MKCIEACQNFLWGGTGATTTDEAGNCSCTCGDEGWLGVNILAQASCVPTTAHVMFGAFGLAFSAAGLAHVAYQLDRQVKFHASQVTASSSPIEDCRLLLHITTTIHDVISLVYFIMILVLKDDQLWGSVILLAGAIQITAAISGVQTARMWIYTNDRRLMQETPEILAISNMLERPLGQCISCGVFCIGGVTAAILAAAKRSQAAVVVATVSFICLCVACNVVIRRGGTALVRTIDLSLQNTSRNYRASARSPSAAAPAVGQGEENHDKPAVGRAENEDCPKLLAARKRITMAMSICLALTVVTIGILLFAIISDYGLAAPLVFFGIPMGMTPPFWLFLNVQLHAGRSKPRMQRGANGESGVSQHASTVGEKLKSGFSTLLSTKSQTRVVCVCSTDEP